MNACASNVSARMYLLYFCISWLLLAPVRHSSRLMRAGDSDARGRGSGGGLRLSGREGLAMKLNELTARFDDPASVWLVFDWDKTLKGPYTGNVSLKEGGAPPWRRKLAADLRGGEPTVAALEASPFRKFVVTAKEPTVDSVKNLMEEPGTADREVPIFKRLKACFEADYGTSLDNTKFLRCANYHDGSQQNPKRSLSYQDGNSRDDMLVSVSESSTGEVIKYRSARGVATVARIGQVYAAKYEKAEAIALMLRTVPLTGVPMPRKVFFFDDNVMNAQMVHSKVPELLKDVENADLYSNIEVEGIWWDPYEEETRGEIQLPSPLGVDFQLYGYDNGACLYQVPLEFYGVDKAEQERRWKKYGEMWTQKYIKVPKPEKASEAKLAIEDQRPPGKLKIPAGLQAITKLAAPLKKSKKDEASTKSKVSSKGKATPKALPPPPSAAKGKGVGKGKGKSNGKGSAESVRLATDDRLKEEGEQLRATANVDPVVQKSSAERLGQASLGASATSLALDVPERVEKRKGKSRGKGSAESTKLATDESLKEESAQLRATASAEPVSEKSSAEQSEQASLGTSAKSLVVDVQKQRASSSTAEYRKVDMREQIVAAGRDFFRKYGLLLADVFIAVVVFIFICSCCGNRSSAR